ncbi:aspartate/glutamate racemase family protein [Aneurinibacillus sp. Ricciae_BoGa-3]|uniref:aspartate/glutamate racemase family protein n=1 Tax=Aneurinibacillus sp. Ricciae_BoGa-3 TaxID=3022697 RepID=UPI002342100B|nr:aspartate/glutamate racemase family protein [Aneurinibacillus sp. Ricciae_BoGa-3]WCK55223.1 aspartate/glutamate racemase family protein [Aneurinibacillus sp. Ricciae_BoGa-3]
MKCIGIIGGISWESTAHYYSSLNQGVKERLGGLHSARILLWSVDFAEIEALQRAGDWERAGEIFADIAGRLDRGGAECVLIAANTMHKVANYVKRAISIPLIHIGDATAKAVLESGTKRVLLLGTRYTMEQPFLTDHLSNLGLNIVVPDTDDISSVNRIIYEELCLGRVMDSSRDCLMNIISRNKERGIKGVILGCTELAMILQPQHLDLSLFDTTAIHVESALNFSLQM